MIQVGMPDGTTREAGVCERCHREPGIGLLVHFSPDFTKIWCGACWFYEVADALS